MVKDTSRAALMTPDLLVSGKPKGRPKKAHPLSSAQRMKRLRATRKAAGLCVECGQSVMAAIPAAEFRERALAILRPMLNNDYRSEEQYEAHEAWKKQVLPLFQPQPGDVFYAPVVGGDGVETGDLLWEVELSGPEPASEAAARTHAARLESSYGRSTVLSCVAKVTVVDKLGDHPWYGLISCSEHGFYLHEAHISHSNPAAVAERLSHLAEKRPLETYLVARIEAC